MMLISAMAILDWVVKNMNVALPPMNLSLAAYTLRVVPVTAEMNMIIFRKMLTIFCFLVSIFTICSFQKL